MVFTTKAKSDILISPVDNSEGKPAEARNAKVQHDFHYASGSSTIPFLRNAALALALALEGLAAAAEGGDITEIPFEQLLETDIVSAAKLAKQVSDAPSAVSIITARDIREYGYRTLADILNAMRGLYVSQGPYYGFLGGRGYGSPGDYAGRITLLIDGYRTSDNYYGQSYFLTDGLLDVELIDRVEYIPGPGSSSHGDSAFLGVINVITRKGKDFGAPVLSQEFGSHGWKKTRLTYGEQFANGLDLLFSASDYRNNGRDLFDPSERWERESARRYFLKATYSGWQFESAWVSRPAYDFAGVKQVDDNSFASLKYDGALSDKLRISTHAYWGQYVYKVLPDDSAGYLPYGTTGRWAGIDVKLAASWFDRHTLVFGSEYRNDYRQDSWDLGYDPVNIYHARKTLSLYAYDDIQLTSNLQINLGGRFDSRDNGSRTLSPRGAVIYSPRAGTTLKLSTGIAHRQPTQFEESYYTAPQVERVRTSEFVWEEHLGPRTRLTGSLYRYRVDQCGYWCGEQFIRTRGAELEFEHRWENGAHLRASLANQNARDGDGARMANVPARIAKLNFGFPIAGEALHFGAGARYISDRLDTNGENAPAGAIADFTLSGKWRALSVILSARNVFNKHYLDLTPGGGYPVDGRNYWLQLSLDLK